MFYPVESLKRGGRFHLCWLADSWPERFASITQRQLWSHDIRKICDDLLDVMTNESGRPINRFSLRLSSQLMRGLVRLYQRKVAVYLVDLCMTNASVFKHANKKWHIAEVVDKEQIRLPLAIVELPQEVPVEPENEQQIAQLIQNSGNVVHNIQDITLKEAVIPEFQLPPNDGFGEEHPWQPLQHLLDTAHHTVDHTIDHTENRTIDHTADRTIDHTENRTIDHTANRTIDHTADRTIDHTENRTIDHTANRTIDHTADRTIDHTENRTIDHTANRTIDHTADRTVELIRGDAAAHQLSAGWAHTSTLQPSPRHSGHAHMEPAAELDLTLFRKSMGQELAGDFEKDIPEIPEIPIPDMPVPVPQADKQSPEVGPICEVPIVGEQMEQAQKVTETVEIELQELEEIPTKRRKKNKLIIDKHIKIGAKVLQARINNPRLELRCEDATDDVFVFRLPADYYFRRLAHTGYKFRSHVANKLNRLLLRNLGVVPRQTDEREMEEPRVQRSPRRHERSVLERLEEGTVVHDKTPPVVQPIDQPLEADVVQDATFVIDQPILEQPMQTEVDITDLPTQKLETFSQSEKRKAEEVDIESRKRLRASAYISLRETRQFAIETEVSIAEAEKENIPQQITQSPSKSPDKSHRIVLSMLEQAGLADVCETRLTDSVPDFRTQVEKNVRTAGSESSETQLGSLDRTKVSLGDSDKTTDSIRLIREQWGAVGTMVKILQSIKRDPDQAITVWHLMSKWPVVQEYKHVIAARCFASILKLKQHGFIIVYKNPDNLEIRNIRLGSKFD